jgi:hypothetical protein
MPVGQEALKWKTCPVRVEYQRTEMLSSRVHKNTKALYIS